MGLFENNVNNGMLLIGTFLKETDFKEITMTFESLTGYLKIYRNFCECIQTNHIILRDLFNVQLNDCLNTQIIS